MAIHSIDSHQHFWQLSRGDYDWLTHDLAPLYRDFLPEDLGVHITAARVSKTIVVQAAPTDAETDFILALADSTEFIGGVVGWVDMESSAATNRLKTLAENPWFKGIRPMIQDIKDDNWMLKPELQPAFECLIEQDLTFDALVFPRHLQNLKILLKRYPELKVVVNHGAKPDIAGEIWQPWAEEIASIGEETNTYCKLSGLLTEAGERTEHAAIKPYISQLLTSFGTSRLMWGSDWPVLNLAGDYQSWHDMAVKFIDDSAPTAKGAIMGKNAQAFYHITIQGEET